ncbi:hypothetical protein I352_01129 [Cryptococcus deuterogattii MMRL2647]|nr:hypothetical protein I352_01129 [Cryptococcus deuterogattii MMRL2647]
MLSTAAPHLQPIDFACKASEPLGKEHQIGKQTPTIPTSRAKRMSWNQRAQVLCDLLEGQRPGEELPRDQGFRRLNQTTSALQLLRIPLRSRSVRLSRQVS